MQLGGQKTLDSVKIIPLDLSKHECPEWPTLLVCHCSLEASTRVHFVRSLAFYRSVAKGAKGPDLTYNAYNMSNMSIFIKKQTKEMKQKKK